MLSDIRDVNLWACRDGITTMISSIPRTSLCRGCFCFIKLKSNYKRPMPWTLRLWVVEVVRLWAIGFISSWAVEFVSSIQPSFISPTCKTVWAYAHARTMYTIESDVSRRHVGDTEMTTETICNFNILRNCMFFSNFAHYLGIQNNFI